MSLDYEKIGLKSGLEIHQQLDTHKLFCDCPSETSENNFGPQVRRKLIATKGERGKIDVAAQREQEKHKEFVYICNSTNSCLVDIDEEPPHQLNKEAIKIAIQIAKMMHMEIVDEIQIMRKIVVDGSNTTGFQRTSLIGMNGFVEVDGKKIGIETLCLEEDSARKIEEKNNVVIYNLDRLGIPLVEITTAPDMNTPEEVKKVAETIGLILRSVRVKRGLGTIRQDVNVSILGGVRTEIKGVQNLREIPKIIDNEISRQQTLLKIKKELIGKKIDFGKTTDLKKVFEKTQSKLIQKIFSEKNNSIYGIKLGGLKGVMGTQTMPGRRIGTEISDYIKSLIPIGGIFHRDEMPNYGITQEEVDAVLEELGCGEEDNFILVACDGDTADKIFDVAKKRIELLSKEIPKETRNALKDGVSKYMRPMSTGERMYPETDVIPVVPDLNVELPKTIHEKIEEYISWGLGGNEAKTIAKDYSAIFESLVEKFKDIKPAFISDLLLSKKHELKKKRYDEDLIDNKLDEEIFELIFSHLSEGKITKDSIDLILEDHLKGKLEISKYFVLSEEEIKAEIDSILKEGIDERRLVGVVMSKLRGKADPKLITNLIKKIQNKQKD